MTCYGHVNISSSLIHVYNNIIKYIVYVYSLYTYKYSIDKSKKKIKFLQWIFQFYYSL